MKHSILAQQLLRFRAEQIRAAEIASANARAAAHTNTSAPIIGEKRPYNTAESTAVVTQEKKKACTTSNATMSMNGM